jgi:hypothetical protein
VPVSNICEVEEKGRMQHGRAVPEIRTAQGSVGSGTRPHCWSPTPKESGPRHFVHDTANRRFSRVTSAYYTRPHRRLFACFCCAGININSPCPGLRYCTASSSLACLVSHKMALLEHYFELSMLKGTDLVRDYEPYGWGDNMLCIRL